MNKNSFVLKESKIILWTYLNLEKQQTKINYDHILLCCYATTFHIDADIILMNFNRGRSFTSLNIKQFIFRSFYEKERSQMYFSGIEKQFEIYCNY